MWHNRKDNRPIRRRAGNSALIDTVKDLAWNLEVDGMFVREHRVWVIEMLMRTQEGYLVLACRRYNWRTIRRIFKLKGGASIERYWP